VDFVLRTSQSVLEQVWMVQVHHSLWLLGEIKRSIENEIPKAAASITWYTVFQ
jgi:hypothetical protein